MSKRTVRQGFLAAVFDALFSLAGLVIWWCVKLIARAGWWLGCQAARHPRTTSTLLGLGGAVYLVGWEIVAGIIGLLFLSGSVWKAADADSFERFVGAFLRHWWRRWYTYRRAWDRVMRRCGLVIEDREQLHTPGLDGIKFGQLWDEVTIRLLPGQEPDDFERAKERLRTAWGGLRVEVTEVKPASVRVDLMRRDLLAEGPIEPAPMPASTAEVDFRNLPIGRDDRGRVYAVNLLDGNHVAVMAETNAGKSGVEWNLLRAMAPAIGEGLVKPVFVDPKRRELRKGLALLGDAVGIYDTRYNELGKPVDGPDPSGDYAVTDRDTVALFDRVQAELDQANKDAAERGDRDFVPSKATPLRPIFIDEGAPLMSWWSRSVRDKIRTSMGRILTEGRAAGYVLIFLIQESTKDKFDARDLFPYRIGLKLPSESYTDAALADDAVERGALCHRIPKSLPGLGYARDDVAESIIRMRLGYVQDTDIADLVDLVTRLRLRELARTDAAGAIADGEIDEEIDLIESDEEVSV